jgi:hypothetical protein
VWIVGGEVYEQWRGPDVVIYSCAGFGKAMEGVPWDGWMDGWWKSGGKGEMEGSGLAGLNDF